MRRPTNVPNAKHRRSKSVQRQAQVVDKLLQRGFELHQKGHLAAARDFYEEVLAMQPEQFDALQLSGTLASQSNNPQLAVDLFGKAIEIDPSNADVYSNRGIAFKNLALYDEAVASYDRAIALKPDYAQAHYNRGIALKDLKRFDEAMASFDRAIAIKPDFAAAHTNRGVTLQDLDRVDEALAAHDRAIALRTDDAEAYCNRGVALQSLKRLDEAVASYDQAIALKPDFAQAYSNRGNALQDLMRLDEAMASYDRAIAIQPDYAKAYLDKSLGLLLLGDFDRGWKMYEWRWKAEKIAGRTEHFPQTPWLGAEPIRGKTILLHAEQGLGDSIQFCRYAKLVSGLGANVLLEAPKTLIGLFEGLEGVGDLVEMGKPLPAFDFHCPLLSLPLAFKTAIETIPTPDAYLASNPEKKKAWSEQLGEKIKPRIGLVWSGSTTHKNDRNRSLTLENLMMHLPGNCEYVSLQTEVREGDKKALHGSGIKDYGGKIEDFSDTAALCDLMDLVVSVDTSVAHLAGALGKTTWVLLPYVPDWRWLLDREDSPWYRSVKLYRQPQYGHWEPVLRRIAMELPIFLRGHFRITEMAPDAGEIEGSIPSIVK